MDKQQGSGAAFIALGAAFLAIGLSTNKAFIAIALVFLVLGIGRAQRDK